MTDQLPSKADRLPKLQMRLAEWEAEKLKSTPAADFADLFIFLLRREIAKEAGNV